MNADRIQPFIHKFILFLLLLVTLGAVAFGLRSTNHPINLTPVYQSLARIEKLTPDLEDIKKRLSDLEQQVSLITSQANQSKQSQKAIRPIKVLLDGSHVNDPFLGTKESPLILMAFTNYQCSPCRKFALDTLPALLTDYINSGKIRFILRDLPLPSNPNSSAAASYAHCAGEQGEYWAIHDVFFSSPELIDKGNFASALKKVDNIDPEKVTSCAQSGKYDNEIIRDFEEAKRIGAKGAPSFLLAKSIADNTYVGVFIRGAQPYPVFKRQIELLLSSKGKV